MAKASAGGAGPDIALIAIVGLVGFMALRARPAQGQVVQQVRPDMTSAQRNLAYTQMGLGLLGSVAGLFGTGSPETLYGGSSPVSGVFGGSGFDVLNFNSGQGALDYAGSGFTPAEFGGMNGAYTFGSQVQYPNFGTY